MIPSKEIRDWANDELLERRAHLVDFIKKAMGSHYPKIWGGEIGQIDKELERRRAKKVLHISFDPEISGYRFETDTKRGRRRVWPPKLHPGEEVCQNADYFRAWFKKLKVTHIHSEFGEKKTSRDCIKDGTYTVAAYLKWWSLSEEED